STLILTLLAACAGCAGGSSGGDGSPDAHDGSILVDGGDLDGSLGDGTSDTTIAADDGGDASVDGGSGEGATSDAGDADLDALGDGAIAEAIDETIVTGTCDGGDVTFTGTTFAPNGVDPIPHVLVYVTSDTQTFPAAPTGVDCLACTAPTGALAIATSAIDGTFTIPATGLDAGGTYTFVMQTGLFRRVIRHVAVASCTPVSLAAAQTSFPGSSAGDDVAPKIAVASDPSGTADVNDKLVQVLKAIGVTYDTFLPDKKGAATTGDLIGLLNDPTTLAGYEILAIPCGALGDFTVKPTLTPAIVSNLQAWLKAGGRLYVSDLAYEVVAQSDAADFTWAPGPSTHAIDDPGNSGVGIATGTSISANVVDADLLAWLQAIHAVTAPTTTIPIVDLRDPWGALDSITTAVDAKGKPLGTTFVSASVSWHEGTTAVGPAVHPLTAQVDIPGASGDRCGRVVFTSYHVQSASSGSGLTPQEHVLEYLFFQLSRCVDQ
ncbi:MAG: hypothetical protein ACHREM_33275, partial [Polyangiales bacterium]